MTSSRTIVANKQKNSNYRPNFALAPHILKETVELDSTEKVVELNGSFWVASKFEGRYYRVVVLDGVWNCSASDERVARMCKASVEAYIASTSGTWVDVASWTSEAVYQMRCNRQGVAVECNCPSRVPCKHIKSHNQVFSVPMRNVA